MSGNSTRAHSLVPRAGDGIYCESLPLFGARAFDVGADGQASGFRAITRAGWTGGLFSLRLTSLRLGGRPVLVGGSRTSLIFTILDGIGNGTRPVPAIDETTGRLFTAAVIGAVPMPYPRDAGNDDLLVGVRQPHCLGTINPRRSTL